MQFHPNSLYLATGSNDWTARLWDVQRGTCLRVFIGHQGAVSSLALSPDGKYLATAGKLPTLLSNCILFDVNQERILPLAYGISAQENESKK